MSDFKRKSVSRAETLRQRTDQASGEWLKHVNRKLEQVPQSKRRFHLFGKRKNLVAPDTSSFDSDNFNSAKLNDKPMFRPGWRFLSFLLVALFGGTVLSAWKMPEFRVKEVEITGLTRTDPQNIRGLMDVVGEPIFLLQPTILVNKIAKAYPELIGIHVSLEMPASVNVSAVERQPYAAWIVKGQTIWIDTEGQLIPARGNAEISITIEADSLPPIAQQLRDLKYLVDKAVYNKPAIKPTIVSLAYFSMKKSLDAAMLEAIMTLSIWLPQENTFLFEKTRGLGWNDTRGWKVFVGTDLRDLNQKMVLYETIVKQLEKENTKPVLISVEYLTAPYYRTE